MRTNARKFGVRNEIAGGTPVFVDYNVPARRRLKLTAEQLSRLFRDLDEGLPKRAAARKYHIAPMTLYKYVRMRQQLEPLLGNL